MGARDRPLPFKYNYGKKLISAGTAFYLLKYQVFCTTTKGKGGHIIYDKAGGIFRKA